MSYVLVGFNTGWREDMERIKVIQKSKTDAFFMTYVDRDGNPGNYNRERMPESIVKEVLKTGGSRDAHKRYIKMFNPEFSFTSQSSESRPFGLLDLQQKGGA